MVTAETRHTLLTAVAACEDKKGEDTRILELDPVDSGLADYFLITSATNDRQVVAIADEIEFRLKKEYGLYATSVEGRRQAEWILLDYVDIVIHVFLADKRAFYDIERLRKSARTLTSAEVEAELKAALVKKTRAVRAGKTSSAADKKAAEKQTTRGGTTVSAKKAVKKAVKKAAPKKAAAKKPVAKKAVKKAVKKAPAKKAAAKKPAKKVVAKKVAAKKPAKKAVKKAAPKKAAAKKPAKKVAAKKVVAKKVVAKKAPAKKAVAKKAAPKKPAAKKVVKAATSHINVTPPKSPEVGLMMPPNTKAEAPEGIK